MFSESFYEVLSSAGLINDKNDLQNIVRLAGGKNSSVHLFETRFSKYIVKKYPYDPSGKRLQAEYNFISVICENGIKNVPKPIKKLIDLNIGIYSYIDGKPIKKATNSSIKASAEFIIDLNQKVKVGAFDIDRAQDSFFSYQELISSIQKRIIYLCKFKNFNRKTYTEELERLIYLFENLILKNGKDIGTLEKYVGDSKVIVSPSDLGMHNMLQTNEGFAFIDFEYAGYDNVLKLVCDFFCQPRVPITEKQFLQFLDILNENLILQKNIYQTVLKFIPLFRLKWALIILGQVNKDNFEEAFKDRQIDKARSYISQSMEM